MPITIPDPPAGPCTGGSTVALVLPCDPGGEAYGSPTWLDTAEIGGGAPERAAGATPKKPCGGCKSEILAAFQLGADTFKAGMEYERARTAKS